MDQLSVRDVAGGGAHHITEALLQEPHIAKITPIAVYPR